VSPIDRVVVAVPAHDEADLLPECLGSILHAAARVEAGGLDVSVVVAADACTDGTADIVRSWAGAAPQVRLVAGSWRSAGLARAAATEAGLRLGAAPMRRTWIATTDADSAVPAGWLATQLRLAADGWVGVAGIVRLAAEMTEPHTYEQFLRTYRVPGNGRHAHVHGANLGVRGDAYADIGGWAPVALAEDHATWNELVRRGHPVIQSTESWVWTSGRLAGRAPGGFADTLAAARVA